MKDEIISAFAFNVGKEIEKICEERNGNLLAKFEMLEARVHLFRRELIKSNNKNMLNHFDMLFEINTYR